MPTKNFKDGKEIVFKQECCGIKEDQISSNAGFTNLTQLVSLSAALAERKKEKKKFGRMAPNRLENLNKRNSWKKNKKLTSLSPRDSFIALERNDLPNFFKFDENSDIKKSSIRKKNQNASRTIRKKFISKKTYRPNKVAAIAAVRDFCVKPAAGISLNNDWKESRSFQYTVNELNTKQAKRIILSKRASTSSVEKDKWFKNSETKMKAEVSQSRKSSRRKRPDSEWIEETLRRKLSAISISSTNDLKTDSHANLTINEKSTLKTAQSVGDCGLATKSTESNLTTSPLISGDENQSLNNSNFVSESVQVDNLLRVYSDDVKSDPNKADNQQSSCSININQCKTSSSSGLVSGRVGIEVSTQQALGNASSIAKKSSKSKRKKKSVKEEGNKVNETPNRIIVVKAPKIEKEEKKRKKSAKKSKVSSKKMTSKQNLIKIIRIPDNNNSPESEKQKEINYSENEDIFNKKKQNASKNREKHEQSKQRQHYKSSKGHKLDEDKRKKVQDIYANGDAKANHGKDFNQTKANYLTKFIQGSEQPEKKKSFKKLSSSEKYPPQTKSPSKAINKVEDKRKFRDGINYIYTQHHNPVERSSRKSNNHVENFSKEARIVGTLNWHTLAPDINDSIRPDLRGLRKDNSTNVKIRPPPKRFVKPSISSDSENSSCYSTSSVSSDSALSSYSDSSSDNSYSGGSPPAHPNYTKKYINRSSSSENDMKVPIARAFPRRRASSTSSFLQQPIQISNVWNKSKHKHDEAVPARRPNTKLLTGDDKTTKTSDNSFRQTQNDHDFDQKFEKKRTKRFSRCIVAEGEGSNSPWHHHQLVVVSQKPGYHTNRKTCITKSITTKQPSAALISNESDKHPQTIRDLYSLHNVLSNTQNGTVISGYRRADGLRVAIKRISKVTTIRWEKMNSKTVPLELALLCQVNEAHCAGIVQIVEWHETSEAYLLVMVRPHPAVDLYDYVSKHKRIKEHVARHIIKQLVRSLSDCISCGVLHRDVKLENVLLNPETLETTLIDFGCGDYVRDGPYKEFSGTPEYYPPEWFQRKQYDTDTLTSWSIGVLLYSLLCGTLPFKSSQEIREKETNKFPGDIGRKARDLIGLLLQKNPRNRLRMNQILNHPWLSNSSKTPSS